ncbi:MAG TPA: carboxypeptidase M32, partial [Actinomycetota bacterium]|nr:carboxypeptidase M32 [Actinomycetota bacterium]
MDGWEQLDGRLAELADLRRALSLLHWDMEVMMPAGGAATRSRSLATLEGMIHERIADPDLGKIVGELEATEPDDPVKKATLRLLR